MTRLNPITWLRERPLVADGLFATGLAALGVIGLFTENTTEFEFRERDAFVVGLMLLSTLPVVLRRWAPHTVLAVTGTASVLIELFDYYAPIGGLGVLVALYSVAAHTHDRRRSMWALSCTMVAILGIYLAHPGGFEAGGLISNVVLFATAWILGDNLHTRRAYVRSLEERAQLAEAGREEEAREAVRNERVRIARELHDVVAHGVSVMVVQAGAARKVLDRDPARASEAMSAIESTGRESLNELRRLLGMLREAEGSRSGRVPQPGIEHLTTLIEQTRSAGLAVELNVEGTPRPLAAGVDLSAYRIVQEALTNTIKHAGPAKASIRLCYGEDALELVVSDDGRGSLGGGNSRGHGIVGMQERVGVFGGELRVGNRPGGGFTVRATFPLEGAPA